MDKYKKALIRRLESIDEHAKFAIPQQFDRLSALEEEYFVATVINVILFRIRNICSLTQNDMNPEYHKDMNPEYHKSVRKFVTERYEKEIREYYSQHKK